MDETRGPMKRVLYEVKGVVQGVGFRPLVYRLATAQGLGGSVLNTGGGVEIEVEGPAERVDAFPRLLEEALLPPARIESMISRELSCRGLDPFRVLASVDKREGIEVPVLPDAAICEDCWKDATEPGNRRFQYPFVTCSVCGPRFSVIRELPFDRERTTMRAFPLCENCEREYKDPKDRRFHAQTMACPVCGPQCWLEMDGKRTEGKDAWRDASLLLDRGHILAVRGLGGFHLAVDARNERAVRRLRERKERPHKPFALMVPNVEAAERLAFVGSSESDWLRAMEAPIVLLPARPGCDVTALVSPGIKDLGIMVAYTPLHRFLLGEQRCLVMTSGNLGGDPLLTGNEEAREELGAWVDGFLFHDREIHHAIDDSVLFVSAGRTRMVRRARGFTPGTFSLVYPPKEAVLGCGGHLKNTVAVAQDRTAVLSQHVGDLESPRSLTAFEKMIQEYERIYGLKIGTVIHDLHPDYLSTQYAHSRKGVNLVAVQHHKAHVASCMTEHGLEGPVVGVALDGVGLGEDGTIWGGELFVGKLLDLKRVGTLRPLSMPGGDQATQEPWRLVLSCLHELGLDAMREAETIPTLEGIEKERLDLVSQMLQKGIRCLQTSSTGRLFDAFSALAGVRQRITYEGQAAIEFESRMGGQDAEPYRFAVDPSFLGLSQLDWGEAFLTAVSDVRKEKEAAIVSYRFHEGLCLGLAEWIDDVGTKRKLREVVLTGGCLQNRYLSWRLPELLEGKGMTVWLPEKIPCNDGAIALGQVALAGRQTM